MRCINLLLIFQANSILPDNWWFVSAIRGVFGRVLKKQFCLQKNIECAACKFTSCYYRVIFEEQNDSYRPYIFNQIGVCDNNLAIELKLFGEIATKEEFLAAILLHMQNIQINVTGKTVLMELAKISSLSGQLFWEKGNKHVKLPRPINLIAKNLQPQKEVHVKFVTPFRTKHNGKILGEFIPQVFFYALQKRVAYFNNNYGNLALPEFVTANETTFDYDFIWEENWRKSFRQNQKMSLGGLKGSLRIKNINREVLSYLEMGSHIHVGKNTTFGLGKYSIDIKGDK